MLVQISNTLNEQTHDQTPFSERLRQAESLVQRALGEHKSPVIACSFGKHSMVVLHMVRKFRPETKVLWNNTGVEYPDTYRFVQFIRREWKLDVVEANPQKSFWDVVKEAGFPIHPRNAEWKLQRASTECCRQLKKKPTTKALRLLRCDLYFTGLTQYESSLRQMSAKKYGKYFFSVKWNHWKCHPILDWTTTDIWEYHKINDIPHNSLYDKDEIPMKGGIRTGCWCCPMAIKYGKLSHLRHYYPKLFNFLVVKKGLGETMVDLRLNNLKGLTTRKIDYLLNLAVKKGKKFDQILKHRPCFFDKL